MNKQNTSTLTLEDCIVQAVVAGYSESFRVTSAGLITQDSRHTYQPHEVVIMDTCRFDHNKNPRYNSVLYQIKTADGKRGVLIDSYGSYTNERLVNFIDQVPPVPQQVKKNSLFTVINSLFSGRRPGS